MPLKLAGQEGGRHYLDLATTYLSKDPLARTMLTNLNVEVRLVFNGDTRVLNENGIPVIEWDPTSAILVQTPEGQWQVPSPAMGLLHEMIHIYMGLQIRDPKDEQAFEQAVTELESAIGKLLAEPLRLTYEDGKWTVKVANPTAHTKGDKWLQQEPDGTVSVDPYTGNPYEIPNLNPLGPIDIGGSGGGGGRGGPPGAEGGGDFYIPDGVPWIDPSLPRGDVDVIPGAVTPATGGDGGVRRLPEPEAIEVADPVVVAANPEEQPIILVGGFHELAM